MFEEGFELLSVSRNANERSPAACFILGLQSSENAGFDEQVKIVAICQQKGLARSA